MKDLKVAIVTGGGKGIGAAIVRLLASQNIRVVIAEEDVSLKKHFANDPERILFVHTDVKSEASIKRMVQTTLKKFGRIDALINNAARLPKHLPSIENLELKVWDEFIATNLTGTFLCSKHAIPHLRKTKGSIVNMASTRALQSEGTDAPYSATKGGLVALTHALAVALGPEIRVNAISPGWVNSTGESLRKKDHEQHPVGRVGIPDDIASMVAYLISDQAGFITGSNFVVDGGMTIKMIYA